MRASQQDREPVVGAAPRLAGVGLIIGVGLLAGGCQAPPQPTGPTELVLQISDYDRFVDDTVSFLRQCDFPPDYVDRATGVIISKPATSAQWFEPWRVDSPGGYQTIESSLHTMRRVVTVSIAAEGASSAGAESQPAMLASGAQYRVAVQVDKARHSAPERQVTTASGALAIYSERLPTTEGLRGARSRGEAWVPLGRDGLLEAYLLARLADLPPASQVDVTE